MSMAKAFLIVIAAYALAGAAAVGTGIWFHAQPPIVIVGLANLAATIVVFLFSVLTDNSSMYASYWSVAPFPIALFWLLQPSFNGVVNPRHVLIFVLLCLWAIRLTANWATQWRGLRHEDWRYEEIRKQAGFFYWTASLFGIHLMPTILVFLGSLALWPTLSDRNTGLTWLDGVAALVMLTAVLIEGTADLQMRRFLSNAGTAGEVGSPGRWWASSPSDTFSCGPLFGWLCHL